jgi:hypothetical protein
LEANDRRGLARLRLLAIVIVEDEFIQLCSALMGLLIIISVAGS